MPTNGPNEFKTFLAWKLIADFTIFIIHSPVLTFNQYVIYIQYFSEIRSFHGSSGMHLILLNMSSVNIIPTYSLNFNRLLTYFRWFFTNMSKSLLCNTLGHAHYVHFVHTSSRNMLWSFLLFILVTFET